MTEKKEVHKTDPTKMEYHFLGNTGLKASVVGNGNLVSHKNESSSIAFLKLVSIPLP